MGEEVSAEEVKENRQPSSQFCQRLALSASKGYSLCKHLIFSLLVCFTPYWKFPNLLVPYLSLIPLLVRSLTAGLRAPWLTGNFSSLWS